jgi:hypothetical protein
VHDGRYKGALGTGNRLAAFASEGREWTERGDWEKNHKQADRDRSASRLGREDRSWWEDEHEKVKNK